MTNGWDDCRMSSFLHNFTQDDLRMMEQVIVRIVRKPTFPFSIRPLLTFFVLFSEWVPSWLPSGPLAVSLGTLGHLLVSLRSSWGTCGILARRLLESVETGCHFPKNKPGIPAPARKDKASVVLPRHPWHSRKCTWCQKRLLGPHLHTHSRSDSC